MVLASWYHSWSYLITRECCFSAGAVRGTCSMRSASLLMSYIVAALVAFLPPLTLGAEDTQDVGVGTAGESKSPTTSATALAPKEVARIVSSERANQQFTDDICIDETFEKLEVPILEGSSALPAVTLAEWPVFDEHPLASAPWEPSSSEEFLRLCKLKIGPGRELTDSETSSRSNNVRMALWPSGHVLWMANQGKRQILRNKKGELVEYRFAKIDFDIARKRIEDLICKEHRPQGLYRKAVLYDDLHAAGVKYHKLVVVGNEYVFRSVTQVAEQHEDAYYKERRFKFSVERPRDDVQQFIDICDVIRNVLPAEGEWELLRSEPAYVWLGKTDLSAVPVEGDRSSGKSVMP